METIQTYFHNAPLEPRFRPTPECVGTQIADSHQVASLNESKSKPMSTLLNAGAQIPSAEFQTMAGLNQNQTPPYDTKAMDLKTSQGTVDPPPRPTHAQRLTPPLTPAEPAQQQMNKNIITQNQYYSSYPGNYPTNINQLPSIMQVMPNEFMDYNYINMQGSDTRSHMTYGYPSMIHTPPGHVQQGLLPQVTNTPGMPPNYGDNRSMNFQQPLHPAYQVAHNSNTSNIILQCQTPNQPGFNNTYNTVQSQFPLNNTSAYQPIDTNPPAAPYAKFLNYIEDSRTNGRESNKPEFYKYNEATTPRSFINITDHSEDSGLEYSLKRKNGSSDRPGFTITKKRSTRLFDPEEREWDEGRNFKPSREEAIQMLNASYSAINRRNRDSEEFEEKRTTKLLNMLRDAVASNKESDEVTGFILSKSIDEAYATQRKEFRDAIEQLNVPAIKTADDRWICALCPNKSITYVYHKHLLRHAANHLVVKPFKCPFCPKRFRRSDTARRHHLSCDELIRIVGPNFDLSKVKGYNRVRTDSVEEIQSAIQPLAAANSSDEEPCPAVVASLKSETDNKPKITSMEIPPVVMPIHK